uniref:Integrator complex subunit putative n=1 Tax=Albugo laibachii Nc14 TaxID=890382 RepID=F0VYW0_9STRA|nr:integrator complex subunit putative [Albugo laibachii Nc14]|eukprot:CCA13975.1 integrator complex subunit putative [Albugo laibachii Nc14]
MDIGIEMSMRPIRGLPRRFVRRKNVVHDDSEDEEDDRPDSTPIKDNEALNEDDDEEEDEEEEWNGDSEDDEDDADEDENEDGKSTESDKSTLQSINAAKMRSKRPFKRQMSSNSSNDSSKSKRRFFGSINTSRSVSAMDSDRVEDQNYAPSVTFKQHTKSPKFKAIRDSETHPFENRKKPSSNNVEPYDSNSDTSEFMASESDFGTPPPIKISPNKKPGTPSKVPFRDIQDLIDSAKSEESILKVLKSVFGSLVRDQKPPTRVLSIGLLRAVKKDTKRFKHPEIIKFFLRLLRSKHNREHTSGSSSEVPIKKPQSIRTSTLANTMGPNKLSVITEAIEMELPVSALVPNLLVQILKDDEEWPVDCVKVYLSDSLNARSWVNDDLCHLFVLNVKTILEDDTASGKIKAHRCRFRDPEVVRNTRELIVNHLRHRIMELDKERAGIGPGGGNICTVRNMILTLSELVSLAPLRLLAISRLETWLQNPVLKPVAKDLLCKVIQQCKTMQPADLEVVDIFLKIKWKPTMFQFRVETLTQLVQQHPLYLRHALYVLIARERSSNIGSDVDNFKLLQHIFRATRATTNNDESTFYSHPMIHAGEAASKDLAHVIRELAGASDFAPMLKTILRKILKQVGFDMIDLKSICTGMLVNDGHWDTLTKFGDTRLPDHMSLITGLIWLLLLMRGAAVKSLEIQHSSSSALSSGRNISSTTVSNSAGGPITRRLAGGINSRGSKLGPSSQSSTLRISTTGSYLNRTSSSSPPADAKQTTKAFPTSGNTSIALSGPNISSKSKATAELAKVSSVKIAFRAKEELLQALAHVQRQSVFCCREIFNYFQLDGASSFEKILYQVIVKKLLFLEVPPDVQPTEHDKTCFESVKEGIPLQKDTIPALVDLYTITTAIDRLEALQTLELIVFRAAEGQCNRESVWESAESLKTYAENEGIIGLELRSIDFIGKLVQLTRYPPQHSSQTSEEVCYTDRFWIACSILLILGCFNPTIVGIHLWRNVPTLRAMMQMIIADRFVFPPVLEHDPLLLLGAQRRLEGSASQFESLDISIQRLSACEAHLERSLDSTDSLMVFDFYGVARKPSSSLLEHFRALGVKYKLGNRLRQSRQCDFLTEMVAGDLGSSEVPTRFSGQIDTQRDQAWWIADIVCEDFETVQYLPVTSLCNLLLLLYIRQRSNHATKTIKKPLTTEDDISREPLVHIGPKLLAKLHNLLHVSDKDDDQACTIVRFFVDKLADSDRVIRRVASGILSMLLKPSTDKAIKVEVEPSMSMEDIEGKVFASIGPGATDDALAFSWLPLLTKLACYDQISEPVALCFENLLAREASISSLTSCIQTMYAFWRDSTTDGVHSAEKSPGVSLDQVSMLAHVFGKFLTKRRLIANALLSNDQVFGIFVEVFAVAVTDQVEIGMKQLSVTSITEFKVIHVMDKNHKIQELKLPIASFHGIVFLLSNWTRFLSHLEPSERNVSEEQTLQNLKLLKHALFPRSVASRGSSSSSNVVRSSTGLIATKDVKLCPESLLLELLLSICIVKPTASADCNDEIDDLVHTVGKSLSVKSLWKSLLSSYHSLTCWSMIFEKLHAKLMQNEEHAENSLQDAIFESPIVPHDANKSTVRDCAALILDIFLKLKHDFIGSDGEELNANGSYEFVKNWLQQKSNLESVQSPSSALMIPSKKKVEPLSHLLDWEQIQTQADSMPSSFLNFETCQVPTISDRQTVPESEPSTEFPASPKARDTTPSKCLEQFLRRCRDNDMKTSSIRDEQVALERFLSEISSNVQMMACSTPGAKQLADFLLGDVFLPALKKSSATNEKTYKRILQYILCIIADAQSALAISSFTDTFITALESSLGMIPDEKQYLVAEFLEVIFDFLRDALNHTGSASLPMSSFTLKALSSLVLVSRLIALKHEGAQTLCERLLVRSETMVFPLLVHRCAISECDSDSSVLALLHQEIIHFSPRQWFSFQSTSIRLVEEARSEALMSVYLTDPIRVSALMPEELHTHLVLETAKDLKDWARLVCRNKVTNVIDEIVREIFSTLLDDTASTLTKSKGGIVSRASLLNQLHSLVVNHPLLLVARLPTQFDRFSGSITLTQLYLRSNWFEQLMEIIDALDPLLCQFSVLLFPISRILLKFLQLMVQYQTLGFQASVLRVLEYFRHTLLMDFEGASRVIVRPEAAALLRNVILLYENEDRIARFKFLTEAIATAALGEEICVDSLPFSSNGCISITSAARAIATNSFDIVMEEQQTLAILQQNSQPLASLSSDTIQQIVQILERLLFAKFADGVSESARELKIVNACKALLDSKIAPLNAISSLLGSSSASSKMATSICQIVLQVLRHGEDRIAYRKTIVDHYLQALTSSDRERKVTLVAFACDMSVFCDRSQRKKLLQHLFLHDSRSAKNCILEHFQSVVVGSQLKLLVGSS